jgi:hypothetical protein
MSQLATGHGFSVRPDMRWVGVVQLRVGGRLYAVPVQATDFASETSDSTETGSRGGFFVHGDQMGILVDASAGEEQFQKQVMEGCAQAVRHLSAKFLN